MASTSEETKQSVLDYFGATWGDGSSGKTTKRQEMNYVRFDRDVHLTVGSGDKEKVYARRTNAEKQSSTTFKYGQLKLFLSELSFLNIYFDPDLHKNSKVVYVGAALGTHIATLAKMYPMIEFHLYDPQPFHDEVLEPVDNIFMYNTMFEDSDVEEWAERKENGENIFLVVDIRNIKYDSNVSKRNRKAWFANEKLVIDNMNLQQTWHEKIKPNKSLLKMRLPYSEDFMNQKQNMFEYMDGIIYLQQFAGPTSSETRFVPSDATDDGDYKKITYDIRIYEKMLSSHNLEMRLFGKFINPFSIEYKDIGQQDNIAEKIGLTNDYDSTAATIIIMDYMTKFGVYVSYDGFYELARNIFDQIGIGTAWNRNLRGVREGEKFITENGDVVDQDRKSEFDDYEEDPDNNE
jgi:hypothetical protein